MTQMMKHNDFRRSVVNSVAHTARENAGSNSENMDTTTLNALADRVVGIYVNNTEEVARRKIRRVLTKNTTFAQRADVISERMMNVLHQNFS